MLIHHHLSNREPAGLLLTQAAQSQRRDKLERRMGRRGRRVQEGDPHACGWFTLMCGKTPQLTKKMTWRWTSRRGRWPLGNLGDLASEAPN